MMFATPAIVGTSVLMYFLSGNIQFMIALLDGLTSHVLMFSHVVLEIVIVTSLCSF